MHSFTPGPWLCREKLGMDTVGREHYYVCGQHKNSGPVLTVALVTGQMVGPERQASNARLIAAAPRLYDYTLKKAKSGDSEAAAIIQEIDSAS